MKLKVDPVKNYAQVKAWRARPENKAKRAAQAARWREKHPDLCKEIQKRHYDNNAERLRPIGAERKRAARARDPEGNKRRSAEFRARRAAQRAMEAGAPPKPEVCDLCSELNLRIVFDHCHAKGHFRGWLCDRCNKVLGLLRDDSGLLRAMADYLDRGQRKNGQADSQNPECDTDQGLCRAGS